MGEGEGKEWAESEMGRVGGRRSLFSVLFFLRSAERGTEDGVN